MTADVGLLISVMSFFFAIGGMVMSYAKNQQKNENTERKLDSKLAEIEKWQDKTDARITLLTEEANNEKNINTAKITRLEVTNEMILRIVQEIKDKMDKR